LKEEKIMAVIDASTAAKAGKAAGAENIPSGTFEAAKAKAAGKLGLKVADNGDGTYNVSGDTNGHAWSKTFVDTTGSSQSVGHADPAYTAKVKTLLQKSSGEAEPGQAAAGAKTYGGKSMENGGGGKSRLLHDRITLEMVNKGYSHETASSSASKAVKANAIHKGWTPDGQQSAPAAKAA
jgi:hypothetical protein